MRDVGSRGLLEWMEHKEEQVCDYVAEISSDRIDSKYKSPESPWVAGSYQGVVRVLESEAWMLFMKKMQATGKR